MLHHMAKSLILMLNHIVQVCDPTFTIKTEIYGRLLLLFFFNK